MFFEPNLEKRSVFQCDERFILVLVMRNLDTTLSTKKRENCLFLPSTHHHPLCTSSSEKFLGHQVNSYGQPLSITFTSETPELLPDHVTLLLQGSGITLSADLSFQPGFEHDAALTAQRSFVVRYESSF